MSKDFVYKKRLLKLASYLDTLPPERFSFNSWVGSDWQGKANLSCGTTACALGHATSLPAFRKLGLRLIYFISSHKIAVGLVGDDKAFTVDYSCGCSIRASSAIFGTTDFEFEFLFIPAEQQNKSNLIEQEERYGVTSPASTATAKEVSEHIRHFVKFKYGS